MIHIRDEGETLKQGVNIYPSTSKSSRGFVLRIFNWLFRCRYSLVLQQWLIGTGKVEKLSDAEIKQMLNDIEYYQKRVEELEQPTEPRLVSYALDGSTCTLNIDGEEVYFNREQPAQEPVGFKKALQLSCEESKKAFEPKNPIGYLYSNNTWVSDETDPLKTGVPFYTEQIYAVIPCAHPHQWQGLTDDEMEKIMHYLNMPVKFSGDIKSFARAIEQALKEKNT
jgi:hypothetical protein